MMDEMMRQAFQTPYSKRKERHKTQGPYVYGFSMTTGPDGKPVIKEFGNIKRDRQPTKAQIREIKEQTEPLVDVLEQDKTITILAQLPGAKQEDIHVDVNEAQVTISVDIEEHNFYKKLQLPALVEPQSIETTFRNGVLQIKLQKMLLTETSHKE
jgi:HSP20 family protein